MPKVLNIEVTKEKVSLVDGKLIHDKYIANGNAVAMKKTKGGMRDVFTCPEGYIWISCDYASEEMKLMACFSGEQNLIQPILDGSDIHKYVATKMFGHYDPTHRTIAKTINFAANYGASGYTIGKRLGVSEQEGNELLRKYNQALPALTRWKEEMIKEAKRKGMVFTYFGRPRVLYMYYNSSKPSDWSFADRSAVNSPVQGTGGDLIRIDHVKLWQKFLDDADFSENAKYACTVHDEINLFVKPSYLYKAITILQDIMNFKPANFPLVINTSGSVGPDWGHQIEFDSITEDNKIHFNDLQGSLEEQQEAFRQEHSDLF